MFFAAVEPQTFERVAHLDDGFFTDTTSHEAMAALARDPHAVLIDKETALSFNVHRGDTVKWITLTQKDPHTVSFPDLQENFSPQDPIQPVCEGATGDTAATGPPPHFGCGASPVEFAVDLFPQGPTQISDSTTMASSGVIATFGGLPDRYSFSFPNSGTFSYQCRIHDHMNGVVTVAP